MLTESTFLEGYRQTEQEWEVIVNHEIHGVTPEEIDWWWDHIDSTERYKLWHPNDHVSFEWLVAPTTQGHVGAVQRIREFLNGLPTIPATLEIRWEDAREVHAEYRHVLLATVMGAETQGTFMHEYEATLAGTRMRSHFHLVLHTPAFLIQALYAHNQQEMQNLSTFLSALYRSEDSERRRT